MRNSTSDSSNEHEQSSKDKESVVVGVRIGKYKRGVGGWWVWRGSKEKMVRGFNGGVRSVAKHYKKQQRKQEEEEEEEEERKGRLASLGPRSFPLEVKEACWGKAESVPGRDPSRWRRDPLGNTVFRKLVACPGCLCYDFDHIVPYSKTAANRAKGNRQNVSKTELIQKSSSCRLSGKDMDLVEFSTYGDIHHKDEPGGCRIQ